MIIVNRKNKKKAAFTLVELMLLLVILSLVLASSYSLITRRHREVPKRSVHGQYLCLKELQPKGEMRPSTDNDTVPTATNHCYANENREIHLSGSIITKQECVKACRFVPPRTSSYIYMQLIGGGGAGGNANYNPLLANQVKVNGANEVNKFVYERKTYDRAINLVERDWKRYETNDHLKAAGDQKYKPKDEDSKGEGNLITNLKSWGGATTFAGSTQKENSTTEYNGTLIKDIKYSVFNPRLEGKKKKCTGSCSDEVIARYCTGTDCVNNCTDSSCKEVTDASYSYALNGPLNEVKRVKVNSLSGVTSLWSPGIRANLNYKYGGNAIANGNEVSGDGEATRGISRDYVNRHFTFHALERQVAPNVEKNKFVDRFLYSGPLFDDTLFEQFLNDYIIDKMFAYDIGGKGPSAPGFNITPFKNGTYNSYDSTTSNGGYKCIYYASDGTTPSAYNGSSPIVNFADCVAYAYNHGFLGNGRNRYCSLPLSTGTWPTISTTDRNRMVLPSNGYNPAQIQKTTLNNADIIKLILGYETSSHEFVRGTCPIMNRYWVRRGQGNQSISCTGGAGGAGSVFTSPMVDGFKYEFFPVLGVRWRSAQFLKDTADRCDSSGSGDNSLLCYQRHAKRPCNPNESGVSDDDDTLNDSNNSGDVDSIDFGCRNTSKAVNIVPDLSKGNPSYSGGYIELGQRWTFPGNSAINTYTDEYAGTFQTLTNCNASDPTCMTLNGTPYRKLYINNTYYNAPEFSTRPNIHNAWRIPDFEQPQFKNVHFFVGGYPHGFGGSGTNLGNGVGVGYSYEGLVDSSGKPDIVYNACIAPGVSARTNDHQISPSSYSVPNSFISTKTIDTHVSENDKKNNATTNTEYQFRYNPEYIPASRNILSAGNAAAYIYNNFNSNACNQGYLDFSSYFGKSCFAPKTALTRFTHDDKPKYYWFKNLMERSNPWIMCYNSSETAQCMTAVDLNANTLGQLIVNIFGGGSYGSFAFGMTSNSNSNNPAKACLGVPLKRLASEDGNAIMPDIARPNTSSYSPDVVEKAYSARIPRAFGTPHNTPWNLTKDTIRESLVNSEGQYLGDGSCPTPPPGGNVGNTGFDYNTYGNRLLLVGRTGFLLKRNVTQWTRSNSSAPWIATENANIRSTVLGAADSWKDPAQTTTLSDERKAGLNIKLVYYTHALSYGEPGKSGKYRSIFARSFTNANVLLVPGMGGRASLMDPREASRNTPNANGGQGGITAVAIGCNVNEGDVFDSLVINNENKLEVHSGDDIRIATCASIIPTDGGPGGRSGRLDPAEYGNLHQNHDFIRKANEKLTGINDANATTTNGITDDDDNNFKHCSLSAPNPWKESPTDGEGCVTIDNKHYCIDQSIIDRYRHPNASGVPSGPPLIEGDCYGNGGVLAEDSVFAAQANLFDLEQFLGDDIQPELIGKGGDGGFVRDDCWVVPQYFEVDGLYILRSSDLTPTSSNATSTTGNTRTATQAFTGSWADGRTGLTSFLQSQHFLSVRNTIGTNLNTSLATQGYYKYFDNRYANVLADNMGHVMLWPTAIFHYQLGSRSCRTWGARYTGHGKVDINSNANARNEIMSVDDYSKGKYDDDISANREDKIIGETGHFTSPDGQIIRYRISGLTTFDAEGNRTTDNSSLLINSIFGTEIGGTDGYPGAVFITW